MPLLVSCLDASREFLTAFPEYDVCQVGFQGICERFILSNALICVLTNIKKPTDITLDQLNPFYGFFFFLIQKHHIANKTFKN